MLVGDSFYSLSLPRVSQPNLTKVVQFKEPSQHQHQIGVFGIDGGD